MSNDPARLAAEISELLASRLRAKGGDLSTRIARARRVLPRSVRAEAGEIARAAELSAHPKLRRQIDPERTARAFERVRAHLSGIDPRQARRTAMLNMAAGASFVFISLATAALFILVQEGVLGPQPPGPQVTRAAQP